MASALDPKYDICRRAPTDLQPHCEGYIDQCYAYKNKGVDVSSRSFYLESEVTGKSKALTFTACKMKALIYAKKKEPPKKISSKSAPQQKKKTDKDTSAPRNKAVKPDAYYCRNLGGDFLLFCTGYVEQCKAQARGKTDLETQKFILRAANGSKKVVVGFERCRQSALAFAMKNEGPKGLKTKTHKTTPKKTDEEIPFAENEYRETELSYTNFSYLEQGMGSFDLKNSIIDQKKLMEENLTLANELANLRGERRQLAGTDSQVVDDYDDPVTVVLMNNAEYLETHLKKIKEDLWEQLDIYDYSMVDLVDYVTYKIRLADNQCFAKVFAGLNDAEVEERMQYLKENRKAKVNWLGCLSEEGIRNEMRRAVSSLRENVSTAIHYRNMWLKEEKNNHTSQTYDEYIGSLKGNKRFSSRLNRTMQSILWFGIPTPEKRDIVFNK